MDIKNNKPHANKKGSYKQGYYKIYNSFKYKGDPTKCIYRSSWEFKCMKWLDDNPEVEWWASEPFCISYFYPAPYGDNKQHSYYPDLVFKIGDIVYVSEEEPSAAKWAERSASTRAKKLRAASTSFLRTETVKNFSWTMPLPLVALSRSIWLYSSR